MGHEVSGAPPRSRYTAAAATVSLFVAAIVALYVGDFIMFHETEASDDEQVLRLAAVALLLVLAALAIAVTDRTARRALGFAFASLTAVLVVASTANEAFRFIWASGEAELFYLEVTLGLAAMVLVTPRFFVRSPEGGSAASTSALTPWARAVAYLIGLVIVLLVALSAGIAHFEDTHCVGGEGDCDLAVLEGLLWVSIALVLSVAAIVTAEVVRAKRRRRSQQPKPVAPDGRADPPRRTTV